MKMIKLIPATEWTVHPIREDVFEFALEMSRMMQIKEIEDKCEPTFISALQEIEAQMARLKDQIEHGGGVSADFTTVHRRLTHVANFAMIAKGLIKTQ